MRIKTIEEQFGFEENPAGSGLMYFIRYSSDRIDGHRMHVLKALREMGVKFRRAGNEIEVRGPSCMGTVSQEYLRRSGALLEELSILNEASEYHDGGAEPFRHIEKLKDVVKLTYYGLLARHKTEDAYSYVSCQVPSITEELREADANKCLYGRERRAIDEIERFCEVQAEILDKKPMVMFGS